MDEAKRLNMLDGHFFWLWIDITRKIDVFYDIDNKKANVKDNNLENYERVKRERNEADNKLFTKTHLTNTNSLQTRIAFTEESNENNDSVIVENDYQFKSFIKRSKNDISKENTHIVSNKLVYLNFSESYNGSRNISTENIRDYYIVNNKGVETSKIDNNSIEKVKKPFINFNTEHISDNIVNETFNKYVNSISVEKIENGRMLSLRNEIIHYEQDSSELKKDEMFARDVSEMKMNPSVHIPLLHSLRDTIEKRKDQYFTEEIYYDDEIIKLRNNVTEIFNNLPVGLLALRPQPMKIG